MSKTFGAHMRKIRLAEGLGLRETARAIGISATYLSMLERGLREEPGDQTLRRWADILQLHPDEMFWQAGKLPVHTRKHIKRHACEITVAIEQMARKGGW